MGINKIHQGDCLEVMKDIKDSSVDLPYGVFQPFIEATYLMREFIFIKEGNKFNIEAINIMKGNASKEEEIFNA